MVNLLAAVSLPLLLFRYFFVIGFMFFVASQKKHDLRVNLVVDLLVFQQPLNLVHLEAVVRR